MEKYLVTGMSCAACVAHVEKAVNKVEGVKDVSVSLLTNSMTVEGDVSPEAVISAVEKAGYGAEQVGGSRSGGAGEGYSGNNSPGAGDGAGTSPGTVPDSFSDASFRLQDRETGKMVRRLVSSIIFLLPLMYLSMGHMMWNWPVPFFLQENHIGIALTEMLFCIVIMFLNRKFFINGFKGIIHGGANMDTLVAMGSGISFGYSLYILYAMTFYEAAGDEAAVHTLMMELYFESAAMILTLITVGKTLESYSKGRTTDALKGLVSLIPKKATVIRDGQELLIDTSTLKNGDILRIKPGESIPADAVITQGITSVDESALTGESIPVEKHPGDKISLGTINADGAITAEVVAVGEDTALSRIINMVKEASASKAPIARMADRVAGVFVPAVLCVAVLTAAVWLYLGFGWGEALRHAIAVLVISCPCALGLATPVAIMVGSGMGAKNGILFKNATALEEAGRADTVVFDKTGTVTEGRPKVTDVFPAEGVSSARLLQVAYALEEQSEHPLGRAVVEYLDAQPDKESLLLGKDGVSPFTVQNLRVIPGRGIQGEDASGSVYYGGKSSWISGLYSDADLNHAFYSFERMVDLEGKEKKGKTPLFFAEENRILGVIFVADTLREDSKEAILRLKKMGKETILLTGDARNTAHSIAEEVGIDRVIAEVLPEEKAGVISKLKKKGKVIMVGDGINDAPALTTADVGFAIGAGTDVAIDAAEVVLVNNSLNDAVNAIYLSGKVLTNIKQNLFWAFFYNVIGIPLAAGAWYPVFGWSLSPMFGAAAMSLSSIFVVSNALRLNLVKLPHKSAKLPQGNAKLPRGNEEFPRENVKTDHENVVSTTKGKGDIMNKTMNISGMMCEHCEMHVKKALEALNGVDSAVVSHKAGTAELSLSHEVENDALTQAVVDAGYEVKGIQ